MLFRLSNKLNAKIKAGKLGALPLGENPLTDWSAHLFVAARTQYVLLSNTKTLYSAVMHGKGITNGSRFIERALISIRELLEGEGQKSAHDRWIAPAASSGRFAKALDRSVTGSMNDLIGHATAWLAGGGLSPQNVAVRLNGILLSALAPGGAAAYGKPRDAFEALVGGNEGGGR